MLPEHLRTSPIIIGLLFGAEPLRIYGHVCVSGVRGLFSKTMLRSLG